MGIKRIAKLANVSIGTVDRVLHNRGGVSKQTESKILKIIKETGYHKNLTASRLKLASVKKIKFAVLTPKIQDEYSYWKLPKLGVSEAVDELKELGVNVDYFEFLDTSSFRESSKRILSKNYDAIITVPFFENESIYLLESAKLKNVPVVFLDTRIPLKGTGYFIRQNSHKAGMVAGRLLHGCVGTKGRYFIVNILDDTGVQGNNQQRGDGFRAFFKSIATEVNITTINHLLNDTFKTTKEVEEGFQSSDLKGIFVTNSRAHLIAEILKKHKVRNTYVLGFDLNNKNLAYLKNNEINFLINQQPKYQGYIAVIRLFHFLTEKNDFEPDFEMPELDLEIPVEIIVKENMFSI